MSEEYLRNIGTVELYRKREDDKTCLILRTGGRTRDLVSTAQNPGNSRNRPSHDHLVGAFFDFSDLEAVLKDHRINDKSLGIKSDLEQISRYDIILTMNQQGSVERIEVKDKKGASFGTFPDYASVVQYFTNLCLGDVPTPQRFKPIINNLGYEID